MSKTGKHSTPSFPRTKGQRDKISLGVRIMLEAAEAEYRTRCHRTYTLADLIDEYRSAELLGPIGQRLFDRTVELHLDDWLHLPVAQIDKTKILGRFAFLYLRNRLDEARWVVTVMRELRGFAKLAHPELNIGNDPIVDLPTFFITTDGQEH